MDSKKSKQTRLSRSNERAGLLRQANGEIEMLLLQISLDYKLFNPIPDPCSWMLNFSSDPNFKSIIRHIISPSFSTINFSTFKSDVRNITMDQYLKAASEFQDLDSISKEVSDPVLPEPSHAEPASDAAPSQPWRTGPKSFPKIRDSLVDSKVNKTPLKIIKYSYDQMKIDRDMYGLTSSFDSSTSVHRNLIVVKDNRVKHRRARVKRGPIYDILIYAPPHSGKSTLQNSSKDFIISGLDVGPCNRFLDTDDIFDWKHTTSRVTITNMPHLIAKAKYSVAIIPSEAEFIKRCEARKLVVQPGWYSGMVREATEADVVFHDDAMLSDLIAKHCRKRDLFRFKN